MIKRRFAIFAAVLLALAVCIFCAWRLQDADKGDAPGGLAQKYGLDAPPAATDAPADIDVGFSAKP